MNANLLAQEAHLFQAKDAHLYLPRDVVGSSVGVDYWTADNPPFGAIFTYYLRDGATTLKGERRKAERELADDADIPFPGWEALDEEMNEVADKVELVVRDMNGSVVNRVSGGTSAGLHRVAWNLRHASQGRIEPGERSGNNGFLAVPGTYTATLTRTADGTMTDLAGPMTFNVVPLYDPTLDGAAPAAIAAFRETMEGLQAEMAAFGDTWQEQMDLVEAMQTAHARATNPNADLTTQLHVARERLLAMERRGRGYSSKREPGERNDPSAQSRMFAGFRGLNTTYGPTEMHRQQVAMAQAELLALQTELDAFVSAEMPTLQSALEATGAPPISTE